MSDPSRHSAIADPRNSLHDVTYTLGGTDLDVDAIVATDLLKVFRYPEVRHKGDLVGIRPEVTNSLRFALGFFSMPDEAASEVERFIKAEEAFLSTTSQYTARGARSVLSCLILSGSKSGPTLYLPSGLLRALGRLGIDFTFTSVEHPVASASVDS